VIQGRGNGLFNVYDAKNMAVLLMLPPKIMQGTSSKIIFRSCNLTKMDYVKFANPLKSKKIDENRI